MRHKVTGLHRLRWCTRAAASPHAAGKVAQHTFIEAHESRGWPPVTASLNTLALQGPRSSTHLGKQRPEEAADAMAQPCAEAREDDLRLVRCRSPVPLRRRQRGVQALSILCEHIKSLVEHSHDLQIAVHISVRSRLSMLHF